MNRVDFKGCDTMYVNSIFQILNCLKVSFFHWQEYFSWLFHPSYNTWLRWLSRQNRQSPAAIVSSMPPSCRRYQVQCLLLRVESAGYCCNFWLVILALDNGNLLNEFICVAAWWPSFQIQLDWYQFLLSLLHILTLLLIIYRNIVKCKTV